MNVQRRNLAKSYSLGNADDDQSIAGYSLVELLVVLAIIALIAGLAVPQVLRYLGSARTETAKTQVKSIESAIELYYVDNGAYPSTENGLAALAKAPATAASWNGPYLRNAEALKDPWGRNYSYKFNDSERSFSIASFGRDGKLGGEGEDQDVSN